MFGFLKRKQAKTEKAASDAHRSAAADIQRLTHKIVKDGDLSDADAAALESASQLAGVPMESVTAAAQDLVALPAAKRLAEQCGQLTRELDAAKAAEREYMAGLAKVREEFETTLAKELDALRAKRAAIRAQLDQVRAAEAEVTRIERERWQLLGLPDPRVTEKARTKRRHLSRALQHSDLRPVDGVQVVLLEELMTGRKAFDPTAEYMPMHGQDPKELVELVGTASRVAPGRTRYIFERSKSTFTPLNFSMFSRGEIISEVDDACETILNGGHRGTLFLPAPGTDPSMHSKWEARIADARRERALRDGSNAKEARERHLSQR